MKMAVFWDFAPCSLVEIYRRFRDTYCLHHQALTALMMDAESTSESSVRFYQTTWRNVPEDSHLYTNYMVRKLLTRSDEWRRYASISYAFYVVWVRTVYCSEPVFIKPINFCLDVVQCRGLLSNTKANWIRTASRHPPTTTPAVADFI
jgi:hypothetical protein